MTTLTSMDDPSQLRISDADRHRVAEVLREAAGEGRIDFEELDERLESTYAARTYADLVPIVADLPIAHLPDLPRATAPVPRLGGTGQPDVVRPGRAREHHVAIMSGLDRRGDWTVPESLTVLALMGGANLDMRSAAFSAREVTITVNAVMGGAEIVVGPSTVVIMEGIGIMGGFTGPERPTQQVDDPVIVRVRGIALMGGVTVKRRSPR